MGLEPMSSPLIPLLWEEEGQFELELELIGLAYSIMLT